MNHNEANETLNHYFGQNATGRLTLMIKAKHFLFGDNFVEFKFANSPRKVAGKFKANHVKLVKEGCEVKIIFGRIKNVKMFGVSMPEYEVIATHEAFENEVNMIFQEETGFLTSLK